MKKYPLRMSRKRDCGHRLHNENHHRNLSYRRTDKYKEGPIDQDIG